MQLRLGLAFTELLSPGSRSFEELNVAKDRESDSIVEEERLYAFFRQFRVNNE